MHIAPMTNHDLAEAAALDRTLSLRPWNEAMFAEELRLGHCLTLRADDGTLAGLAVARPQFDEWHIMTLGVAQEWRRRGWGRRLMTALIDAARQAGMVQLLLEVRASNTPALALYRSLGFRELSLRRGYFVHEDGVVMTLSLQPPREE